MNEHLKKQNTFISASQAEKISETVPGGVPNSTLESIMKGSAAPSSAMLGHRESLAPSLQDKMQSAFGADYSNLEVYRSETAKHAGFSGIASGNKIALSPDIDLNSHMGQAVLGHELSHIVAQAQGIGTGGRGIMETPGLERQAMIEGERAASGMRAFAGDGLSMDTAPTFSEGISSFGGEALTPISATTGAFGMGAPMQGKKDEIDSPQEANEEMHEGMMMNEEMGGRLSWAEAEYKRDPKNADLSELAYLRAIDTLRRAPDAANQYSARYAKEVFGNQSFHDEDDDSLDEDFEAVMKKLQWNAG